MTAVTNVEKRLAQRQKARGDLFVSLLESVDLLNVYTAFEKSVRSGNRAETQQCVEQLLAVFPGWNELVIEFGRIIDSQGDHKAAIDFIESNLPATKNPDPLKRKIFQILVERDPDAAAVYGVAQGAKFLGGGLALAALESLIRKTSRYSLLSLYQAAVLRLVLRAKSVPVETVQFAHWSIKADESNLLLWQRHAEQLPKESEFYKTLKSFLDLWAGRVESADILIRAATIKLDSEMIASISVVRPRVSNMASDMISGVSSEVIKKYARTLLSAESVSAVHGRRTAVCISGQLRDMVGAAAGIKRLIESLDEPDIYFATWRGNGVRFPSKNLSHISRVFSSRACELIDKHFVSGAELTARYPSLRSWLNNFDEVSEEVVRKVYPSASNVEILDDPFEDSAAVASIFGGRFVRNVNQLRMYYLANRAISSASETNRYSAIVRLRPDVLIDIDPSALVNAIERVNENDNLVLVDAITNGNLPSDSFAVGSTRAMHLYGALIDFAREYGDPDFYQKNIGPHQILFDHLQFLGVEMDILHGASIKGFLSPTINDVEFSAMIEKDRDDALESAFERDFRTLVI